MASASFPRLCSFVPLLFLLVGLYPSLPWGRIGPSRVHSSLWEAYLTPAPPQAPPPASPLLCSYPDPQGGGGEEGMGEKGAALVNRRPHRSGQRLQERREGGDTVGCGV